MSAKDYYNHISRNSLDADLIFEHDDETIFLCFIDASKLRDHKDMEPEDAPVWSITRIQVVNENGVKTYVRMYPGGSKHFEFSVSEKDNYDYQFGK